MKCRYASLEERFGKLEKRVRSLANIQPELGIVAAEDMISHELRRVSSDVVYQELADTGVVEILKYYITKLNHLFVLLDQMDKDSAKAQAFVDQVTKEIK